MKKSEQFENRKRGYLNEDFRLFYLKDCSSNKYELHYHDFNKIVVFVSGNVSYSIEGKIYRLRPWDFVFVSTNQVHQALIDTSEPYERFVIWINTWFLDQHILNGCNLMNLFETAGKNSTNVLRLDEDVLEEARSILIKLEKASKENLFGQQILKNALFLQLMVLLNRQSQSFEESSIKEDIKLDKTVISLIEYINSNLREDLSIESLANRFFLSKYHLMRKFKQQTGCSLHSYILKKRLIYSQSMIKNGYSAYDASIESGFNDYSTFLRAYKKMFAATPRESQYHFKLNQ